MWGATKEGFLSKRGVIFSHTWSDTLKTKDHTQAVYCKFDMKIILMPLWKETIAWTVDIARSLAMLQKNTQCTRSAHIEFWMQLNSLFNKCRRTVILIFTKLCHRKKSSRTWEHLSDGPLDFWLGVRGGAGGLGNEPQKNRSQP